MVARTRQIDYRRKVKTVEELRQILGPRPRKLSVIMCHGTFDLVHAGHVRHLTFARNKADILVASLTCDAQVSKSDYRPFVPQQLRAMNVAALEVVDYVIIDDNPTPIENIKLLQPDFFAKGYEYLDGGIRARTNEELDATTSYGGEMIFTPGDVVYSSSTFIDYAPPDLSVEKLVIVMESERVSFDALREGLAAAADVRVHILGDTIVDSYIHCTLIGSSTSKTPTLSVKQETQVDFVGGAAVIARHLRQAGADVRFSTVLGDDHLKTFVLERLAENGVDCQPSIDATRDTTQKRVYVAGGYRMLKVDRVDNRPISDKILAEFAASLSSSDADAFIFSDYRHGIFNRSSIPQLKAALPTGPLRVADSQVASRWGNILDFQGFDLITPNEREARFALGDQDSVIRPLSLELYKKAQCKTLILKLGDRGIMTYRAPSSDAGSFFGIDSFAENVVDPVGAGDALLAYATLALASTKSEVMASILGSIAAGVACEHEGNNPVDVEEVLGKLNYIEKRAVHV